jgi:hypothetical protein
VKYILFRQKMELDLKVTSSKDIVKGKKMSEFIID